MGSFTPPEVGEKNTLADPKVREALVVLDNLTNGEDKIPNTSLTQSKFTWYTPKVIATEQSRSSTSFGTLTTADEIPNVELAENGLIIVGYLAKFKSSVSEAGRAAIFLGSNQIKKMAAGAVPAVQEAQTVGTAFAGLSSAYSGLSQGGENPGADVTTGQLVHAAGSGIGGVCFLFAAAGTYTVSVQYKATSGSVTAKERKLWAVSLG